MERLKIGVIGAGHMGRNHVRILSEERNYFAFEGIYDVSEEQAEKVASQYGVKVFKTAEELLQEVNAVIIAVPSTLHKETALLAAEYGVHALVEKPLSTNVRDADIMIKVFKEKKLKLAVGHVERFNPVIVELEKILSDVQAFFIEAHRYSPFSGSGRITDTSVVEDLMVHDIDLVCGLMSPFKVTDIRSNGERIMSDRIDFATCMLDFGEDAHAVINASRISQNKERSLTIHTPDSCIYADLLTRTLSISKNTNIVVDGLNANSYTQDSVVQKIFVPSKEPLREELLSLYDSIVYDKPVKVDGGAGMEAVKICEEVVRRIDNRKSRQGEEG